MNVEVLMEYVTYALIAIGVLAFLVSIITQVIKEMPGLKNISDKRRGAGDRSDSVSACSGNPVHLFTDRNHVVLHCRIRDRGIYCLPGRYSAAGRRSQRCGAGQSIISQK